jgi:hypothetical protein
METKRGASVALHGSKTCDIALCAVCGNGIKAFYITQQARMRGWGSEKDRNEPDFCTANEDFGARGGAPPLLKP